MRAALALGFVFGRPEAISAQVRILPKTSQPSATESYVLQVANDRQVAITRIEIRFPRSVKVLSFSERPDWQLQAVQTAQGISSAVWTGELPPARFAEFGFIAVNPVGNVSVVWPAIVTLADGERVLWWTDPRSHTHAPTTLISAPPQKSNLAFALVLCLLALVLALAGLGVAVRSGSKGTDAGFQPGA